MHARDSISDDDAMSAIKATAEFERTCTHLTAWVQLGTGEAMMAASMGDIAQLARRRHWYPTIIIKALHSTQVCPAGAGADSDPYFSGRYSHALSTLLLAYFAAP